MLVFKGFLAYHGLIIKTLYIVYFKKMSQYLVDISYLKCYNSKAWGKNINKPLPILC